jgi:transposase InsO family protein
MTKNAPVFSFTLAFFSADRVISKINRYADQISLTRCLGRADDLESKLSEFRDYYNHERVHSGIEDSTPCEAGGR